MELKTKPVGKAVQVVTGWTTYAVYFSETQAVVLAQGLEQAFSIEHFPDDAKNEAIAAYLITQIELKSIE